MKLFKYAVSLIACAGFLLCGNGCVYNFGEKIRAHGIYYEGGILREVKDDVIYIREFKYSWESKESKPHRKYYAFVPMQKYQMIPEAVSVFRSSPDDVLIWDPDSAREDEFVCVELDDDIAEFLLGEKAELPEWCENRIRTAVESYPQTKRSDYVFCYVRLPKESFFSGENVTRRKVLPERMFALKNMSGRHGVPVAWDEEDHHGFMYSHGAPLFEACLGDSASAYESAEKTAAYPLLYAVSAPVSVCVDFPLSVLGMAPLFIIYMFVDLC